MASETMSQPIMKRFSKARFACCELLRNELLGKSPFVDKINAFGRCKVAHGESRCAAKKANIEKEKFSNIGVC